ncbi:Uncharacterised protein [Vibrio cholerae]|nr:Uncharacterised protein [Vibrio cholerae]
MMQPFVKPNLPQQRITTKLKHTTVTTAAQWDWKRHALTVPLEAFVMAQFSS